MSVYLKKIYSLMSKKRENDSMALSYIQNTNVFCVHELLFMKDLLNIIKKKPDALEVVASFKKKDVDTLSLPFKRCFFEILKTDIHNGNLKAIQVNELGPDNYDGCVFYDVNGQTMFFPYSVKNSTVYVDDCFNKTGVIPFSAALACIINLLNKTLNDRSEYGTTEENVTLKKGFGSNNYKTVINKLIHIRPYKSKDSVEYFGKEIDWSHRWRVRGHWRKVENIGKDRDGDYGVSGFTWVVDHVKGPDDSIILEKTRIISKELLSSRSGVLL